MQQLQQSLLDSMVDIKGAASILGVSTATVRNWIKARHLTPAGNGKRLVFKQEQVLQLKDDIQNGEVARLGKRANKSMSTRSQIHEELLPNSKSGRELENILGIVKKSRLPNETSLLCLAAAFATQRLGFPLETLLDSDSGHDSNTAQKIAWEELRSWAERIRCEAMLIVDHELSMLSVPDYPDFLGSVYQALQAEGDKSKQGAYFTPADVVESMVKDNLDSVGTVLDPGCGTGAFLMAALKELIAQGADRPLDLMCGVDIDPIATSIARLNLIVACPLDRVSAPSIIDHDALKVALGASILSQRKFRYVFSNPPWGANKNASVTQSDLLVTSSESFAQFLALAIELLEPTGRLSFVLPEAILNVKSHEQIRALILSRTRIRRIRELGRAFTGVFTPTIRLDLERSQSYRGKVSVEISNGDTHEVLQDRFRTSEDRIFDIYHTDEDASILRKFRSVDHFFVFDQADWALGIVTGNNKKHVHADKHKSDLEPIFKGKDILKYCLSKPNNYISFERDNFQQVAPTALYRAPEKLVYRFISKYLCFAYDSQQRLTLNSANIMIPRVPEASIKCLLALLNSTPIQYFFQKTFSPLKVLRSHIERIPLPKPDAAGCLKLEQLADSLIHGVDQQCNSIAVQRQIDDYVMDMLCLDESEREIVSSVDVPRKLLP